MYREKKQNTNTNTREERRKEKGGEGRRGERRRGERRGKEEKGGEGRIGGKRKVVTYFLCELHFFIVKHLSKVNFVVGALIHVVLNRLKLDDQIKNRAQLSQNRLKKDQINVLVNSCMYPPSSFKSAACLQK